MDKNFPTIVHIAPYYPPHTGGLERVAKMCAENLAIKGYKVLVLTTTESGLKRGVHETGNLKIIALRSFEFAHTPFAPMFIWQLLRIPKHSIIHLHLAQAYFPELVMLIARLRNIPYIVHFHLDVDASGFLGPLFILYKKLFWYSIMHHAQTVIACAEDQLEIISRKFNIPKEKITVIQNAVSQDFFSNRIYVPPTKEFKLLYIGRLAHQKRLERIIEALVKLSIPAHLTIVGDGEELDKLRILADTLNLRNVSFEGKKNDPEMQEYHRTHDLFLLPSDREGTALVLLEAMAGGLPAIGTDVEGIHDLLIDTGVLVTAPYPENFAKAIEKLWHNPTLLTELSKKSVMKAKKYGWERFMNELEVVYVKIWNKEQ